MSLIHAINQLLDDYHYNENFNPTMLSIENDIDFGTMEHLTSSLSSMGLLGFDLMDNSHFYRRLPFKTERILSLNPRLKNAKKLLENADVQLLTNTPNLIEAYVKGTGVLHKVVIQNGVSKCTCDWFSSYQGKRGICKHILAVHLLEK
jgi:hypothetical protein